MTVTEQTFQQMLQLLLVLRDFTLHIRYQLLQAQLLDDITLF